MKSGTALFSQLMSGEIPDRVPLVCNLFEHGAKELEMPMDRYFKKWENSGLGQLILREKYGYDHLWAFFSMAHFAEIYGVRHLIYSENGPPNLGEMMIKNTDEIADFNFPEKPENTEYFDKIDSLTAYLKKESGGEFPVFSAVVGSYSLPTLVMGMERWMNQLYFGDPSVTADFLEKCSIFIRSCMTALEKAGVDMIVYANPFGSIDILTIEDIRHKVYPWIIKDVEGFSGAGLVYFNGGGRINPTLGDLMDITPFRAFYINPMDSIPEAKNILNGKGLLAGVINDIELIEWEESEIRNEVKRIMDEGKEGGGFIFGTLMMPMAIPETRIHIMMNAAREFGKYE